MHGSKLLPFLLLLLLCPSLTLQQACPPGFNSTQDRCLYIRLGLGVNWCQANRACAAIGTELVTNWAVIQSLSALLPQKDAWIGVSDLASERGTSNVGWQYVNGRGTMPTSSSLWISGDPNNSGGAQDCMTLRYDSVTAMADKECDYTGTTGYVCELPDVPPASNCGSVVGGSGGGRIRWTPAPPPTAGVSNAISKYCYWEQSDVLSLRDCARLAALRPYSRSFLYSVTLKTCHVTEFSDSQTQLELTAGWVKYIKA